MSGADGVSPGARCSAMLDEPELVTVGKIQRPFGVRGAVKVHPLSDVPGRLERLRQVTLVSPTGRVLAGTVVDVRSGGRSFIMQFDVFTTPEEAAEFRGGVLQIPRTESPRLDDDHYYEYELVGMTVQDETGQTLGTLEEIWQLPGHPVFAVRQGRREWLVPATKRVVASINREAHVMVVRLDEGVVEQP